MPPTDIYSNTTFSQRLSPMDSGRFLAVSMVLPDTGARRAWVADGQTGLGHDVLAWRSASSATDPPTVMTSPTSTSALSLPLPAKTVWVTADPLDDRSAWLAPVYLAPGMDGSTPVLYNVDLDNLSRVTAWSADQLLAGHDVDVHTDGFVAGSVQVIQHDGQRVVALDLLGVVDRTGTLTVTGPSIVVAFEPRTDRVLWTREVSYAPLGASAFAMAADQQAAWLGVGYPGDAGGVYANLDRSEQANTVVAIQAERDGNLMCPTTISLLDANNGTAIVQAAITDRAGQPERSVVLISHQNRRVWRIDQIREGLGSNNVFLHGVAVLPP